MGGSRKGRPRCSWREENILQRVNHCATRLRLRSRGMEKVDKARV